MNLYEKSTQVKVNGVYVDKTEPVFSTELAMEHLKRMNYPDGKEIKKMQGTQGEYKLLLRDFDGTYKTPEEKREVESKLASFEFGVKNKDGSLRVPYYRFQFDYPQAKSKKKDKEETVTS